MAFDCEEQCKRINNARFSSNRRKENRILQKPHSLQYEIRMLLIFYCFQKIFVHFFSNRLIFFVIFVVVVELLDFIHKQRKFDCRNKHIFFS
jgi:hypothetical protein